MVKNLPATQETQVQPLGQEDPLEKADLWQSTPVFLPGESHGQRSLASYCPWDHKESDTTGRLTLLLHSDMHMTPFNGETKEPLDESERE